MPWAVKKLLNRSICQCHLGCWIGWAEGSTSSVIFAWLCPYASLGAHQRNHLLAPLLPSEVRTPYHLTPRHHNRQLTPKVNKLCDSNFIQRMLYKDWYWLSCILSAFYFTCRAAFCQLIINEYCIVLYSLNVKAKLKSDVTVTNISQSLPHIMAGKQLA